MEDVAVLLDHHRPASGGSTARSLVEGEDQAVHSGRKRTWCGRVRRRTLPRGAVEERPTVLGLELDQPRLELLEAGIHISGPEAGEAQEIGLDAGP